MLPVTKGRVAVLLVGAVAAVAAFASCTAEGPASPGQSTGTVGSPASVSPSAPVITVTETVTTTVTSTVTPTATPVPTAPHIPAVFNADAARKAGQAIVGILGRLDRDFAGVPATSSATSPPTSGTRPTGTRPTGTATGASAAMREAATHLAALDTQLKKLLAAGVPVGTDGPSYVARILSLQTFVSAAIGETRTNPARAAARYQVIRTEVAVLLTQVGTGTGSSFTLPPPAPAR